jgi:protein KRI1
MATLKALKSKDPAIYNKDVTFYKPFEETEAVVTEQKEKPMYLRDYHRENLLKGNIGDEEEDAPPRTYAQEQEDMKKDLVGQMHAAAEEASDDDEEEGGFLIPKSKPQPVANGVHPSRAGRVKLDIANADKDQDNFLSNYMEARAWVPATSTARFQPMESDDEEEDERAEKFEAAFNMRFEDPQGSNEVLKSYARDVIAQKSVRREEINSRKKQRDAQREKKEAEKRERDEERARLRKLKIDEMEEKLQKIKKAAGIRGKAVKDEDWTKVLDEDWDDNAWEAKMNEKFGEEYYAEKDVVGSDSEGEETKKSKVKKPKWDDDIDIKDLVPDFKDDEEEEKPVFTLSDSENEDMDDDETATKAKSGKDRKEERNAKKKAARLERKKIEELVDSKMDVDLALPSTGKQASKFRYRETSPTSFGLSARDILMASDTALNQFAGLKKMATFRDVDKKRKDKKHLGKKARLRQWRKETFGNEDGPEIVIGAPAEEKPSGDGTDVVEGKRKKKRSRKGKGSTAD